MKSEVETAEERRRRQYRRTARVLREYTARLYRLADQFAGYLDSQKGETVGAAPWAVLRDIWRVVAIQEEFKAVTLIASQMLVHYDLDEIEKADLALRLADAEHAINCAEVASSAIADRYDIRFPLRKSAPRGAPATGPRP
ncbi:hypothetical protein VT84_24310 [Gemmata sp. SH-PL17]|uniref:hypothetical protein n=1 Tax=Gemmata sp. SH-PL17 TaxID=1630693 RepID=UPI00078C16AB|nr:hypothetical protein [Gemmata sp. SH-PL17]AMV27547.1 hypothetical protein VT84_24310 [Gemmata sp. SH-PL17]